jgi:hypothetical protein
MEETSGSVVEPAILLTSAENVHERPGAGAECPARTVGWDAKPSSIQAISDIAADRDA